MFENLKVHQRFQGDMNEATRMITRSSAKKTDTKETKIKIDLKKQPFITYRGKLQYFTDSIDCAIVCDKLLEKASASNDNLIIGFDMEWPFSFQTGSGKTALVQINPLLDECFLFQVSNFKKLPRALTELLSHSNVRLVGVNIKNDIHKLARDFPGINSQLMLDNCIDIRTQANHVLNYTRRWSMEKLVNHFFQMQINKDKSVRNSKWNVLPLTKAQKLYAAIDSYASLKLYLHLKELSQNINL